MTDGQQGKPKRRVSNPIERAYGEKLLLPSFGVSVSRSDPITSSVPVGWGTADFSVDSGDAFSVSYLQENSGTSTANHEFVNLDAGYLRRILLYVLYEEEYERIKEHHSLRSSENRRASVPDQEAAHTSGSRAQVRLTDLRIAADIKPAHLRRELNSSRLPSSLSSESVARWKWETLRKPKELRELADLVENDRWYKEEQIRVKVISFTAAALLLLVDLDMPRLEEAAHDTVVKQVEGVHRVVQDLITKVDSSTNELAELLGARKGTSGGRPPNPDDKYYVALALYRMGRSPKEIAYRVGIRAPGARGKGEKGSKNWKGNLREFISRGIGVEKKLLPRAAEVFARRNEEQIKAKAIETYHDYLAAENWEHAGQYVGSVGIGDDLLGDGIPVDQRQTIYAAMVQLGSCVENDIEPVPGAASKVLLF